MCWGVFLKHVFLNSSWMFGAYILKGWLEKPPCLFGKPWPSITSESTSSTAEGLHLGECCCFFVKKKGIPESLRSSKNQFSPRKKSQKLLILSMRHPGWFIGIQK